MLYIEVVEHASLRYGRTVGALLGDGAEGGILRGAGGAYRILVISSPILKRK